MLQTLLLKALTENERLKVRACFCHCRAIRVMRNICDACMCMLCLVLASLACQCSHVCVCVCVFRTQSDLRVLGSEMDAAMSSASS